MLAERTFQQSRRRSCSGGQSSVLAEWIRCRTYEADPAELVFPASQDWQLLIAAAATRANVPAGQLRHAD
jgi:hypothetical protein